MKAAKRSSFSQHVRELNAVRRWLRKGKYGRFSGVALKERRSLDYVERLEKFTTFQLLK